MSKAHNGFTQKIAGSIVRASVYDGQPKLENPNFCRGRVSDGERHWAGGFCDYSQGLSDIIEPEGPDGEPTDDSYDALREHQQNQKF